MVNAKWLFESATASLFGLLKLNKAIKIANTNINTLENRTDLLFELAKKQTEAIEILGERVRALEAEIDTERVG